MEQPWAALEQAGHHPDDLRLAVQLLEQRVAILRVLKVRFVGLLPVADDARSGHERIKVVDSQPVLRQLLDRRQSLARHHAPIFATQ